MECEIMLLVWQVKLCTSYVQDKKNLNATCIRETEQILNKRKHTVQKRDEKSWSHDKNTGIVSTVCCSLLWSCHWSELVTWQLIAFPLHPEGQLHTVFLIRIKCVPGQTSYVTCHSLFPHFFSYVVQIYFMFDISRHVQTLWELVDTFCCVHTICGEVWRMHVHIMAKFPIVNNVVATLN